VTRRGVLCALLLLCALAALTGCAADGTTSARASAKARRSCPAPSRAGWQALADRIHAPVYCPGWLPDPLTATNSGRWNNIDSVDRRDRSYLISFVWQEPQSGEIHVNLRGYPGRTAIPVCTDTILGSGKVRHRKLPCFADPRGQGHAPGIDATIYTVNQDADQWHVLYAWRHAGSLYTLSEHVALPLSYAKVVANLDRMLRSLVLVRPS
jgi:hypothetical protein